MTPCTDRARKGRPVGVNASSTAIRNAVFLLVLIELRRATDQDRRFPLKASRKA